MLTEDMKILTDLEEIKEKIKSLGTPTEDDVMFNGDQMIQIAELAEKQTQLVVAASLPFEQTMKLLSFWFAVGQALMQSTEVDPDELN